MAKEVTKEYTIRVGLGTCGIAAGGTAVYEALAQEIEKNNLSIPWKKQAVGMCYEEVLVDVISPRETWTYGKVTTKMVPQIIDKHIMGGQTIDHWLVRSRARNRNFCANRKGCPLQL